MDTTQLTQTAAIKSQFGIGLASEDGLSINHSYKGYFNSSQLTEIQNKYPEYLKLEQQTGVPWKAIASLDLAGGGWVTAGGAAKKIQEACQQNQISISPATNRSELLNMMDKAKQNFKPDSKEARILSTAQIYYDEFPSAFAGKQ